MGEGSWLSKTKKVRIVLVNHHPRKTKPPVQQAQRQRQRREVLASLIHTAPICIPSAECPHTHLILHPRPLWRNGSCILHDTGKHRDRESAIRVRCLRQAMAHLGHTRRSGAVQSTNAPAVLLAMLPCKERKVKPAALLYFVHVICCVVSTSTARQIC